MAGSFRPAHLQPNRRGPMLHEIVPWFIAGFLALMVMRSLGFVPALVLPALTRTAALLTTVAMAGLGLGVDVLIVARTGTRVTFAVTASLIALGMMSYALILASEISQWLSDLAPIRHRSGLA